MQTAILNLSKMHEADSKIMWTMYSCYQEQLAHAYTATFVTSICNSHGMKVGSKTAQFMKQTLNPSHCPTYTCSLHWQMLLLNSNTPFRSSSTNTPKYVHAGSRCNNRIPITHAPRLSQKSFQSSSLHESNPLKTHSLRNPVRNLKPDR